ncbi:MAG: MBL fold metallo-hydrolase [Clostridiaceae bacterium]
MENKQSVKITFIANAGVLAEYGGIRFLIDGLQGEEESSFSKVADKTLKYMLAGEGKFKNIDYILFSHEHPDHFAPYYLMQYLKNNNVKRVFLPENDSNTIIGLPQYMKESGIGCELIKLQKGEWLQYKLREHILVTVFGTLHMGPHYADIMNYCYLLNLGTKNILFTADADYLEENFTDALSGVDVDAVFVNPLFFNSKAGRNLIKNIIKPREVIIYHIPFAEDNTYSLRKIVLRDMEKFKSDAYETKALLYEGQSIEI